MRRLTSLLAFIGILISSCSVLEVNKYDINTDLEFQKSEITNINDIDATFTVYNGANETKGFNFNSGCQYGFLILSGDTKIFDSHENVGCTASLTSFEIKENESKTFELYSHYFDVELEPNDYMIKAYLIGYEDEVFATETFTVN